MDLLARWPLPAAPAVRDRLLAAYADPSRGYHDLQHLAEVLQRLEELAAAGEELDELPVVLAAWFHDAVYDGAPDDERRSAELAATELTAAGVDPDVVDEVRRLVLLTAEHRPAPGDANGAALSDADLGILAADEVRYAEYVAAVRREYAHVPDADFRAGRHAVLSALGEAPALFRTATAHARWERRARTNLERELAQLASAGPAGA